MRYAQVPEEILEALAQANPDNGDVYTSEEMAEEIGISIGTMRKRIKKALKEGKIELAKKVITTIAEVQQTVPAYRLKDEKN